MKSKERNIGINWLFEKEERERERERERGRESEGWVGGKPLGQEGR